MCGWIYIIKNGDLYKIGITKNFNIRMRQLKPDKIIARFYSNNFKHIERELHKKYHSERIPQTEYFRLNKHQLKEINQKIYKHYYVATFISDILIKAFPYQILLFIFLILIISLYINNMYYVLFKSLIWMERLSLIYSFLSLFFNSNKYLSLMNEIKFRTTKTFIFILYGLIFRCAHYFLF